MTANSRLARYQIQAELGRGGAGVVYAAVDTRTNCEVALKILHQDQSKTRPMREIRAAALVDHPNIARIFETAEEDGQRFIAMELVRGQPLDVALKDGPLPLTKVLSYSGQVLSALEVAHTMGVVHRDLKPSNFVVTPEGLVKIVDFGLAKVTAPLNLGASGITTSLPISDLTQEGSISGTLAYMSPEQAEGKQVDARTDLFSFGVVMYEMLTGRTLFGRETPVATLVAVMTHEVVRPEEIPPEIWPVVSRCLEKQPNDRWRAAADVRYALEMAAAGVTGAEPTSVVPATSAPLSRRGVLLWGLAAAGLGVGGFWGGRRGSARPVARFERITFDTGEIMTARFGAEGNSVYYSNKAAGTDDFFIYETKIGGNAVRKLELPPAYVESVSAKGDLAVIVIRNPPPGVVARVPVEGGPMKLVADQGVYAAWGPDGTRLMTTRYVGANVLIEYPLGNVVAQAPMTRGNPFQFANLSRDGGKIAYFRSEAHSRFEELRVMDITKPERAERVLSGNWASTAPLQWTPASDEVWFSGSRPGRHNGLWACDMAGRERCLIEAPGQLTLQDIRSTDRAVLAVAHDTKASIKVAATSGGRETELPGLGFPAISDDGATVMCTRASAGAELEIELFIRGSKTPLRLGECKSAVLSPDGNAVAATTGRADRQQVVVIPVGPERAREIGIPGFFCDYLCWFGDGERLLVTGREAGKERRSFVVTVGSGTFTALTEPGEWGELVSRDGRKVLIRNLAGERTVRDLTSGQTEAVKFDPQYVPLVWDADGRAVLVSTTGGGVPEISILRVEVPSGASTRIHRISSHGVVSGAAITPDKRHIAYFNEETNSTVYLIHGLG